MTAIFSTRCNLVTLEMQKPNPAIKEELSTRNLTKYLRNTEKKINIKST